MTAQTAHTAFGPIDGFVLRVRGEADWIWKDIRFDPASFSAAHWTIKRLEDTTVVAIRR